MERGKMVRGREATPGRIKADRHVKLVVLQKVASEMHPKVRNHGEGPY